MFAPKGGNQKICYSNQECIDKHKKALKNKLIQDKEQETFAMFGLTQRRTYLGR